MNHAVASPPAGPAAASPDPIVVIGAPRTGVRLLAALLDGHVRLASGPELPCLVTILRQWQELEQRLSRNHERHFRVTPQCRHQAFRDIVESLLRPRLLMTGKSRFVIQSFAGVVCPDLFQRMFPSARIVLMLRDPRDVAASLLRCDWRVPGQSRRLPCTTDARLAARLWRDCVGIALDRGRSLIVGGRMAVLRYEDLCRAPDAVLARLARFLGEEPPPARVTRQSAGLVATSLDNPHPALRAGPVAADRVGRWMGDLGTAELAATESITGPLMRALGYAGPAVAAGATSAR
ncbi:MAG TPA: sulfotransferase [Steroidobacteraceae bacterium]|jgi:hypothetical protein